MASRVGIELSASCCRIVEVRPSAEASRVVGFAAIPFNPADPGTLTIHLRELLKRKSFSRRVWVAVSGVESAHQWMLLPPAKPADLELLAWREAARDLALLRGDRSDFAVGTSVAASESVAPGKREVVFAAAPAAEIQARLQPILDAGFHVEGVVTRPLALTSIARLRGGTGTGAATAYVAANTEATSLAIVREGVLMFARDLSWGYQSERARDQGRFMNAHEFAAKLGAELRRSFLFFKQTFKLEIDQLITCGDFPELRVMTAPLIELLDLEVETLDSMDGIDVTALPEPAEQFREQVAEFRVAWAIAADARPPINLLPPQIRARRSMRRLQLAVAGGAAAAILIAALLYLQANRSARSHQAMLQDVQSQISTLEPDVRRMEQARMDRASASVRRAALDAFDSQGPRLGRALEALARVTPDVVVLHSVRVAAHGPAWRMLIDGAAYGPNPATGQAAVNEFLRGLQASQYLGAPVRPPSLKIASEAPMLPGWQRQQGPAGSAGADWRKVERPLRERKLHDEYYRAVRRGNLLQEELTPGVNRNRYSQTPGTGSAAAPSPPKADRVSATEFSIELEIRK